ncbi:hypothetical protein [Adhaeribacter rhizoryzae]|uniref:Uncharacterized protein n=1 Tax=Adhaeribacter rhizoryzae TaxID=2607907 RepID=A0A5M6DDR0_9BACT|nr:hypothetical protein [Adhaeribacter rhizoryzae]KAA5545707.1 hypothetical protein F0145_12285 [Adhaeribacter rhizoryzae]
MKFTFTKNIIFAVAGGLLLLVSIVPTFAQTTYTTPAKIKADTRKSKREAVAYKADHKETHLDVAPYNYKIGKAGRKPRMVDEEPTDYSNDKEKNALFESPKKINKKKKLLQAQKQE